MARPVGVLGITKALVAKLEEGGIETIGQLEQFWKAGRVLTDLKGMGAEKSAEIADAWAEYAKEHQEVYGMDDNSEEDDSLIDPPEDDEPEDDD